MSRATTAEKRDPLARPHSPCNPAAFAQNGGRDGLGVDNAVTNILILVIDFALLN